jgi:hypothetical protein
MPIDIEKLEGYKPDMTADEKLALLLKYEPPAPDLTGFIKKDMFDKTASELAEAKKALKAKMTEDEQKEAERLAKQREIEAELAALRKENAITKSKPNFSAWATTKRLLPKQRKRLPKVIWRRCLPIRKSILRMSKRLNAQRL